MEAMLNLIDNHHLETWIDVLKLKYFSKKFHCHRHLTKKRSRLQLIWEHEVKYDIKGGIAEELSKLSKKYDLPDANYFPVEECYLNSKIKSVKKS